MPTRNLTRVLTLSVSLLASVPGQVMADPNLLIILDSSNSMWGQIDGEAKITTAQKVLGTLLTDLPESTNVGLMAYGHREKESCEDIELVSSVGADDRSVLTAKINALQPKGKTPIAAALNASLDAFSNLEGQSNNVVLISDGIETCDGDPCAAAAALASANIQARVHVIGFDVGAEEGTQLQCISQLGNGQYFSAANAEELKVAVAEIKQVAQTPAEPQFIEYYRDDFDGDELSEKWEILNPDPDLFIVEDGALLLVSDSAGLLSAGAVKNHLKLPDSLPEGDWIMTARFTIEFQTSGERPFIGLYQDADNYLEIAGVSLYKKNLCNEDAYFYPNVIKRSKGEEKTTWRDGWHKQLAVCAGSAPIPWLSVVDEIPQPILLRLEKSGRKYIGSMMFEGVEEPTWIEVDSFTILRQKGVPMLGFNQSIAVGSESVVLIDWFKIETKKE